jgi:hypothetical protein
MPLRARVLWLVEKIVPVGLGIFVVAALSGWPLSSPEPQMMALASASAAVTGTAGSGYGLAASDGGVFNYGSMEFHGSAGSLHLNAPIVDMAATPGGGGYWLVGSDGGVFNYGDAVFYGSTGGLRLNSPVVGMAAAPDGGGYWLVASDGGVFTYGDAVFFGSTGGLRIDKPVVGMAATPDGGGYWLVASDGGVFTYGDAVFYGSTGGQDLNASIVGMAATPDGGGYWLVASDGGVFAYGDAVFHGSAGSLNLNASIVGMAATPDGGGYWLVASDGGVFTYGDALFTGSAGAVHLNAPIVGIAPTAPTTTTEPPASRWACVTSDLMGDCPFGTDPQITGTAISSDPYVDQNVWSPISGWRQTLSANSPSDWQVVANGPAGNTAVVAFPNTGVDLSGTVDSYSQTTSSFSETMPHNNQTSAWAMYDLWFNNWNDEVMIQYDFTNNGDCTPVATAQFGGSNGVPVQTWHLCDFTSPGDSGATLDWKLGAGEGTEKQSESSGSIDILAMIKWLENRNYLPAASTWTALSDGWEICSTGGQNETFDLSNYSVNAS